MKKCKNVETVLLLWEAVTKDIAIFKGEAFPKSKPLPNTFFSILVFTKFLNQAQSVMHYQEFF